MRRIIQSLQSGALLAAMCGIVSLSGCGGSSSPTTAPTPTPAPTPRPPEVVLDETGLTIERDFVFGWQFAIGGGGTIDATVDYTHADTGLAVWIAKGVCGSDAFFAEQCDFVATSFAGSKPRVVSATNQTEGTYTLVIWNAGPHDETVSFQVVFSQVLSSATRSSNKKLTPSGPAWGAPARQDLGR